MSPNLRHGVRKRSAAAKTSIDSRPAAATGISDLQLDEDSMDVDMDPQVRLRSSDGKRFTLSKAEASCSIALRTMIESSQNVPNASSEYINLPSVSSQLLAKVIEWCKVHCNDSVAHSNENLYATYPREPGLELSPWDKSFLNQMPEEELFRLIHVANFLDVRSLFNAICVTIGKRWEGKKVDEIRKMYQIESDFTSDEEHQMLQESKRLGMDN